MVRYMYLLICSIHGSDIEASSSLQVKHGAVPAREEKKRELDPVHKHIVLVYVYVLCHT